jgi:hypothetical protein
MNQSLQLITAPPMPTQKFSVRSEALQMRDNALEQAALIGKVENAEQNNSCVSARKSIKSLLSLFESERKTLKEPILEAGRQLDRVIATECEDLKREDGRLENLEKEFIRAEQRRVAEEQELQRRELARIEAEKQAALDRLAREQREREEAAAKLAAEATNKKQRAEADAARLEAEAAAKRTQAQAQLVTDLADRASYVESKPVERTQARGQAVRKVWVIDQINDHALYRARPDLVRSIAWDLTALKQALSDGQKLPGVTAHEDIGVGIRGARNLEAISV